jgi:hypothetical protein
VKEVLVTAGIVFIAAAIIGGGITAFKIGMPPIKSVVRQVILGLFGVILLIIGFNVGDSNGTSTPSSTAASTTTGSSVASTSTTGNTSPGCRLTIVNPLVSMNETPEHQGQQSAKVPPGTYDALDTTITEFAGRDERWFKIEVESRQGWIPDDTILIDSKSADCP